jgi:hypothetical protein
VATDRDLIERTVARLHDDEPMFDWVGVYLVDGDDLVLGPFRGVPTEHVRIPDSNTPDAFGRREVDAIERAAKEIAAGM